MTRYWLIIAGISNGYSGFRIFRKYLSVDSRDIFESSAISMLQPEITSSNQNHSVASVEEKPESKSFSYESHLY
jgi:hypothetical protein